MSDSSTTRKLTPPQIARMWGISPEKVLAWIRSGELRAFNISRHPHGRPRYLVDIDDLAEFEANRAVVNPVSMTKIGTE